MSGLPLPASFCESKVVVEHFLPVVHTNGYAYYCGKCGQVWGRLRTLGNGYFSPFSQYCKQHAKGVDESAGTLLNPPLFWIPEFFGEKGEARLLDRLTPEHLEYEFQQALEWAER